MKIVTRATAIENLKKALGKNLRALSKKYQVTTLELR